MNYVYVPFREKGMDAFAEALVAVKNQVNKLIGRHQLIVRQHDADSTPLSAVGWHDRLYILVHGSSKHAGVCVNPNIMQGRKPAYAKEFVTGEEFADLLIDLGLKNTTIDVRLWTCRGGQDADLYDRDGPDADMRNFALRTASGFKKHGYKDVTVVGYTKNVNISPENLKAHGGHKLLNVDDEDGGFVPVTDDYRVEYQVKAI